MTETSWVRTKEGLVRFPVLKPFTFLVPVHRHREGGLTSITSNERRFVVGEYLLNEENADDAVLLGHVWIHRDFADGCVENPNRTRERLTRESASAKAEDERRASLLKEAEKALGQAEVMAENQRQAGQDVEDDLNRPLNQPRQAKGTAGKKVDPAKLNEELNTPINKLPKG